MRYHCSGKWHWWQGLDTFLFFFRRDKHRYCSCEMLEPLRTRSWLYILLSHSYFSVDPKQQSENQSEWTAWPSAAAPITLTTKLTFSADILFTLEGVTKSNSRTKSEIPHYLRVATLEKSKWFATNFSVESQKKRVAQKRTKEEPTEFIYLPVVLYFL